MKRFAWPKRRGRNWGSAMASSPLGFYLDSRLDQNYFRASLCSTDQVIGDS